MAIAELVVNIVAGTADFNRGMKQLDRQLMSSTKKVQAAGRELSKLSLPILGIGALAGKSAIEFESAFAGVRKTVEGTPEEFAKLSKELKELSERIPVGTTELSNIAEAAGQLGIKKENIIKFTETMAALGVTTNLTSTEAAESLAKFINVTGLSQDKIENLGSTIVALGNNMATTERDIVAMGQRIAASGQQAGLTDDEILALAASLSSVGLEAEAGGTAMSKLVLNMKSAVDTGSSDLAILDEIVKNTGKTFKENFEENSAQAILAFLDGLKKAKEGGQSILPVLEDLGITEVRLRNAVLSATEANEKFREGLVISKTAFNENTALAKEAATRYETLEQQLNITKNMFNNLLIELGDRLTPMLKTINEKVRDVIKWFKGLSDENKDLIVQVGLVVGAFGPLVYIAGTLSGSFLNIIRAGVTLGSTFKNIILGAQVLAGAIKTSLIPAIWGAVSASAAFLATPLGLGIAAISAAVAYMVVNWEDFRRGVGVVLDWFSGAINTTKEVVSDVFEKYAPDSLKSFVHSARQFFSEFKEYVSEIINQVIARFEGLSQKVVEIGKKISDTWEFITGRVSSGTVEITAKQQAFINKAKELGISVYDLKQKLKEQKEVTDEVTESTEAATKKTKENTKAKDENYIATGKKTKAEKEAEAQAKKLKAEQEKQAKAQERQNNQLEELARMLGKEIDPKVKAFRAELQELIDQNPGKTFEELNDQIIILAKKGLDAGLTMGEVKTQIQEAKDAAEGADIFGSMFNPEKWEEFGKEMTSGLAQQVGQQLSAALSSGLNNLLSGGSLRGDIEGLGGTLGSSLGGAMGASIGGPLGAQLGSSLGNVFGNKVGKIISGFGESSKKTFEAVGLVFGGATGLGIAKGINHVFGGGRDPGANARDKLADMFNEAIDKARELGFEMKNFTNLGRNSFNPFVNAAGEKTTQVTEKFKTLSQDAQSMFLDMGKALGAVFDIPDLDSGQFGQLLAINFGMGENSVLDLQIAVQQMGISAEDAAAKVKDAHLQGDLTAKEFIASNKAIVELFSDGIPGALGDTNQAFVNFKTKGLESGTAAIKTLGSIGAEAIEKLDAAGNRAINSLQDLRNDLINSGHSVQDVDAFMQSLAANGISGIEDLRNVTVEQAAGIVSALQDSAFGFEEVKTSVRELRKELDEVKSKEIDVKVNVKTNFDSEISKQAFSGGIQNVTPSNLGNVFNNGAVKQFAKGGVVSKMTAFDIGTMAEQGPEAIMPLERLADGRLGVLSAASSNGEKYVINIDARGAEIGAAARIRREVENYMDKRNNSISRRR